MTKTTATASVTRNVNRAVIGAILAEAGDKIFGIEFEKKDGSIRKMQARLGVTKDLKGVGRNLGEQAKAEIITVYDVANQGYRSFSRDRVKRITLRGNTYIVS